MIASSSLAAASSDPASPSISPDEPSSAKSSSSSAILPTDELPRRSPWGGIRQQFSSRVNIQLAQHSARFYARFGEMLQTPNRTPDAGFRQRGYLFLVNDALVERFERRLAQQRALGAHVSR